MDGYFPNVAVTSSLFDFDWINTKAGRGIVDVCGHMVIHVCI